MKEDYIQTSPYAKTIDQWMVEMKIPSELRTKISTSDVILLPVGYHNRPLAFANGAYEFMEYCIGQNKLNIEICCTDDDFTQIEMCSFQLRLGRYLLPSAVIGVIFWNLISNYISHNQDATIVSNRSFVRIKILSLAITCISNLRF